MLLHNPGGPGGSGVDYLMYLAGELSWKLNYDLVSFDPRGMHHSFPSANCGSQALKARGRLPGSNYPTSFWKVANADVSSLGAACSAQIGGPNDAGPHMSTAVNAKDMLSIVDAFSKTRDGRSSPEPHLLNFWGISYGTFLGQTFASMFPARVRRMVLDANTYPDDFLYGSGANDLVDRDQILASFFDYCSQAGAKKCAFATGNSSTDVRTRFYRSIDGLNAVKAEEEAWANATSITKALIATKRTVWRSVYRPIDGFPRLAEYLSKLERALDINALDQFLAKLTSDLLFAQLTALDPTFEYFAGTICSDSNGFWLNRTFEDLLPGIEKATNTSFLGDEWANFKLYCTKWNIRPKDAFTGKLK